MKKKKKTITSQSQIYTDPREIVRYIFIFLIENLQSIWSASVEHLGVPSPSTLLRSSLCFLLLSSLLNFPASPRILLSANSYSNTETMEMFAPPGQEGKKFTVSKT